MSRRLGVSGLLAATVVSSSAWGADTDLLELVLGRQDRAALERVEHQLAAAPDAPDGGLLYLRARLLARLREPRAAAAAFADALAGFEPLRSHARLGLAAAQLELGHPEVAAGLAVSLLANSGTPTLELEALRVVRASLSAGGDCRLLEGLTQNGFARREVARGLEVAQADCHARAGSLESARSDLLRLLGEKVEDEPGLEAALRLVAIGRFATDAERLVVARALHHHRLFEETLELLRPLIARLPPSLERRSDVDVLYIAARSHFWLEQWTDATLRFGELSRRAAAAGERARALYQQGRSEELAGHADAAYLSFARAVDIDPDGAWAGAALTSALRIDWTGGRRARARGILERLRAEARWREAALRASLFVVAGLVEEGKIEEAATLLEGLDRRELEVTYWKFRAALGRQAEPEAGRLLVQVLDRDPFGPFGRDALARVVSPAGPSAIVPRLLEQSRSSSDLPVLAAAAIVAEAVGDLQALSEIDARVRRVVGATPRGRSVLEAEPRPASQWQSERWGTDTMDTLLRLGLWEEVWGGRMLERFPPTEPWLLLSASEVLVATARPREGVRLAEILATRVAAQIPAPLWPQSLVRLLYPQPWRERLRSETARRGVEPALLYAIVREESRFDPRALSDASARGLTQFVLPTARRLAGDIGRTRLAAEDLYDPDVALALGATYLARLHAELPAEPGRETAVVVAAYNAGEPQARLWRSYCVSDSVPELISKVGFAQTRGYLQRVLRSRELYRRDPQLRGVRRVVVDPPAGARPAGR
jgi:soluble lytic murein transglycosylase-like protein/tetratricopeptide (TPR) repeat protein